MFWADQEVSVFKCQNVHLLAEPVVARPQLRRLDTLKTWRQGGTS